jgi:hypothetical protein
MPPLDLSCVEISRTDGQAHVLLNVALRRWSPALAPSPRPPGTTTLFGTTRRGHRQLAVVRSSWWSIATNAIVAILMVEMEGTEARAAVLDGVDPGTGALLGPTPTQSRFISELFLRRAPSFGIAMLLPPIFSSYRSPGPLDNRSHNRRGFGRERRGPLFCVRSSAAAWRTSRSSYQVGGKT